MLAEVTWAAAGLLLTLPGEMKQVAVQTERVTVLGQPELGSADEHFCSWQDAGARELAVHWWNRLHPARDGGPTVVAEEWQGSLGDLPVAIVRTSQFLGSRKETLAVSTPIHQHGIYVLIHARGIPRETFDRILQETRISADGPGGISVCRAIAPERMEPR